MIIETKLNIPQIISTQIVQRPHLAKRLDDGLNCKVTLVTAPAGYGKTTLLTEWTTDLDYPVAWVSLDDRDRDALRFWRYTIASLRSVFDEQEILRVANADQSGETMIVALINRLNRLSESVVIVWDDFHHIEEPLTLKGITYLLEHLPAHVHLYILSRSLPAIPLARMRARGMLNELGVEDLRFSIKETKTFFNDGHKMKLSQRETEALQRQTEGWITGICLAALYLSAEDDRGRIKKGVLSKYRDISDYFFEEIFNWQPKKMQLFLLKTSLLDRMQAGLCKAVTGINRCEDYLQKLERMNVFLFPLDRQREWYRYHHLFQDFLQWKLNHCFSEEIPIIHGAAGRWLEANDHHHEAIEHYLAGQHYAEALDLLESIAPNLINFELSKLQRWLGRIPDSFLYERPSLLTKGILSLFMTGDIEAAKGKLSWALKEWSEAITSISKVDSEQIQGHLIMLQIIGAFFERDFERAIRFSEEYVRTYPEGEFFVSLGTEGDLEIPNWSLLETIENLNEREMTYRRLLNIWSETKHYYLIADLSIGYGEIMYEWDRLDEAKKYWKQAKQLGEAHGNLVISTFSSILLAKCDGAEGRLNKAKAILTDLNFGIDRQRYPLLYQFTEIHQTYLRLLWGEVDQALNWLKTSPLQVTDDIPNTMLLLEYNVFALLLAKQGEKQEAVALIRRLVNIARQSGRLSECIRFLVQESLLLDQLGESMTSFETLEEALALAEPDGYVRTFLNEGEPLMKLLQRYVIARQKQQIRGRKKVDFIYVKQLLARSGSLPLESTTKLPSILTEKEKEVLHLIAKGLTNKEISCQLDISLSTVKTHINHMYSKLQVGNRMQALNRARQLNLISVSKGTFIMGQQR